MDRQSDILGLFGCSKTTGVLIPNGSQPTDRLPRVSDG